MKAEDLRVGNWVNYPKIDKPIQITGVYLSTPNEIASFVTSYGRTLSFTEIEPIPLTEEILLKCGFVKTEANDYIIMDENCWVVKSKDGWDYQVMTSTNDATFHTVATLQYLHQLQNLHYVLTGTELTVNP